MIPLGPCPRCGSTEPPTETTVDAGVGALAELKCVQCGHSVVGADTDPESGTSARLATATCAVMRHFGYTDAEIAAAVAVTCETAGCEMTPEGYDCSDEDGDSRHPVADDLVITAEILRVGFEAAGVEL